MTQEHTDTTDTRGTDTGTGTATMADVDHTNPYTDRPFGSACAFERGPTVAADGGERDAVEDVDPGDVEPGDVDGVDPDDVDESTVDGPTDATTEGPTDETMADVDHEHPHDGDATTRTFERGREGRDESV